MHMNSSFKYEVFIMDISKASVAANSLDTQLRIVSSTEMEGYTANGEYLLTTNTDRNEGNTPLRIYKNASK